MQTQPAGADWVTSTITNVVTGIALIAVSLAGILLVLALGIRELIDAAMNERLADRADVALEGRE
jgi:hypothetical protein